MTFADSVLHLVRSGARIDSRRGPNAPDSTEVIAAAPESLVADAIAAAASESPAMPDLYEFDSSAEADMPDIAEESARDFEPGMGDLEAAVALVSSGLATRVILSGFQSWPGLLWRAYQLAEESGVLILPAVVRPGGKVDIVITRDTATNG